MEQVGLGRLAKEEKGLAGPAHDLQDKLNLVSAVPQRSEDRCLVFRLSFVGLASLQDFDGVSAFKKRPVGQFAGDGQFRLICRSK